VAVVNARFAREFFPGESPIGKRIAWRDWRDSPGGKAPWMTIVGVAADVKSATLQEPDAPAVYTPYPQRNQAWQRFGTLVVKWRGKPSPVWPAVREALAAVDPVLASIHPMTLDERVRRASAQPRFVAVLASAFGATALILALQGLFALLVFVVGERRREIGIRVAVGATGSDIVGLVLRTGAGLTVAGLVIGTLAAMALQKVVVGVLFEVRPTDPATFVFALLAFTATALAATAVPALRAARTDPVEVLRGD
jgi:hypothetical protein